MVLEGKGKGKGKGKGNGKGEDSAGDAGKWSNLRRQIWLRPLESHISFIAHASILNNDSTLPYGWRA